jgi:hypothetical protein
MRGADGDVDESLTEASWVRSNNIKNGLRNTITVNISSVQLRDSSLNINMCAGAAQQTSQGVAK